ncbi:uncharacterized protein LOC118645208 [Monomorium pharaonis]|uniref:uncharacterized protein LOC118645208 n=1 Tax=Monomorium pharaonis TaxID=307658 RepID=UPI001745D824|nr:uncharacterized protein LOC118645208 [Monomorium pharaonis]XP_036141737.1 uncharacterized protein LOC118645208 [Monomorium pharaonis]XP_036141738.1 uncharacterized protein LOC118645208 [Monomorium pharaonis]XP_036141739.1 uncharacterized protein LOC118645208 [Monomorium pharaonis]XP_036141741.1 uncharacterized protein LOC118645208 [Monomorium pharaonis]
MVTSLNIENTNEQHENISTEPLMLLATNNSPPTEKPTSFISLRTTPTKDFPSTLTSKVSIAARSIGSKQLTQNPINNHGQPVAKRNKKEENKKEALQEALIEALKEPATHIDPLDGFLIRLGEGMRRLPYRTRTKLEIRFLTSLTEMEDSCFNRDSDK